MFKTNKKDALELFDNLLEGRGSHGPFVQSVALQLAHVELIKVVVEPGSQLLLLGTELLLLPDGLLLGRVLLQVVTLAIDNCSGKTRAF